MKRELDAAGYDVTDEAPSQPRRWPMAAVGVGSALAIVAAVTAVGAGRDGARASVQNSEVGPPSVITALGHEVRGGDDAVESFLPLTRNALTGTADRPEGLAADGRDVVPPRVLQGYQGAERLLAADRPECRMPWWVLAGIGKVQSDHAAGGRVDASGRATVRIVGPRLDGTVVDGKLVRDTDRGRLDGDLTFDRAVGPMLVLPATWAGIGRRAADAGEPDVTDVDDAALSVGALLCSAGRDVTTPEGLAAGLVRMNDSTAFAQQVLPWIAFYRAAATAGATPTAPATTGTGTVPAVPVGGVTPGTTATPSVGPGFTTEPAGAAPTAAPTSAAAGNAPNAPVEAPPIVGVAPVAAVPRPARPSAPARPTADRTPAAPPPASRRPVAPAPRPAAPTSRPPAPRPAVPAPRPTASRPTPTPRPRPVRTPRPTEPPPAATTTPAPPPQIVPPQQPAAPTPTEPGDRGGPDRPGRGKARDAKPGRPGQGEKPIKPGKGDERGEPEKRGKSGKSGRGRSSD